MLNKNIGIYGLTVIIILLVTVSVYSDEQNAEVRFVSGTGETLKSGAKQWKQLKHKDSIGENDKIQTKSSSVVEIKFSDGSITVIGENSSVDLEHNKKARVAMKLWIGKLRANVPKLKEKKFEVHTPAATVGVRGTDFAVEVENDNVTKVFVFSGTVDVQDNLGKGSEQISEGSMSRVEAGKPPAKGETMPEEIKMEWDKLTKSDKQDTEKRDESSAKTKEKIKVDSIPPQIILTMNNLKQITNARTLEISGNVEPGSSLNINDNDISVMGNGGFKHNYVLQEGDNVIVFIATDKAGNVSRLAHKITLDTISPIITLENTNLKPDEDGIVQIKGNTELGSKVSVNNIPMQVDSSGNFSGQIELKTGNNQVKIKAEDLAGNISEKDLGNIYLNLPPDPPK